MPSATVRFRFPQKRSSFGLLAVLLVLTACGEAPAQAGGRADAPAPQAKPRKPAPVAGLEEAGLSSIDHLEGSLWRGFSAEGWLVRIQRWSSATKAREVVRQADLLVGEPVGKYAVLGPAPGTDEEGSTARVAACLRRR